MANYGPQSKQACPATGHVTLCSFGLYQMKIDICEKMCPKRWSQFSPRETSTDSQLRTMWHVTSTKQPVRIWHGITPEAASAKLPQPIESQWLHFRDVRQVEMYQKFPVRLLQNVFKRTSNGVVADLREALSYGTQPRCDGAPVRIETKTLHESVCGSDWGKWSGNTCEG